MLGGVGSPSGDDLLTVTVVSDDNEYGMKVSGDNPVYVQSVKEHGAAWRSGLRSGDKILRVNGVAVHNHMHQQVVQMIRANSTTVLTVQQNSSRHKTPITAPVPVNQEKQRQLEAAKAKTFRLMLEQEQKYIRDLRNELSKVPDVRKQAELESAEQRCSTLQHSLDAITTGQPTDMSSSHPQLPTTPKLNARNKHTDKTGSPPPNNTIGFLSGIPRSLSNLTGQSLRNLRQARQKMQQENQPPHFGHTSDVSESKRHSNNSVTCIDNVTPPPLPPRSIERPKRSPLSPGLVNPLAKPKPSGSSPAHKYYKTSSPMHQSMPSPYNKDDNKQFRKSSHSLDGELDGPQPNSIALQMSYPLVNVPPPPLQTDNRSGLSVMHVRSQSSPEHLDHSLQRSNVEEKEAWERGTPPPGTPPPPYAHNTQPCADPQRAIISMEEDDSPASDNSTYSGLFSNVRCVRESNVRMAVLLNWLLSERRCASANLLLVITEGYRSDATASLATLRRWAYEIQSTFLMPNAVLQLSGVDENMANEIEHVLVNEYEKEEILRSVFRKARAKAKEELGAQLSEFQVKRQVGLSTLYGPEDSVLARCLADRTHEQLVVERLMCARLTAVHAARDHHNADRHAALLAALVAAAVCLQCRPAAVAAAVGGSRGTFLQRDKHYKQRVKQLAKQHPQPFVVRGHHLQLQALTSVGHCHHCDNVIWGLAPQAYVCTDCKLRVHRACARLVEEGCCLDGEHHSKRISRFMERIHNHASQPPNNQDSSERKSKKSSNTAHFLNMERSTRKIEDEQQWDTSQTRKSLGESRREGSADEQHPPETDLNTNDLNNKDSSEKDTSRAAPSVGRGVNRAESCRERDAPRRGKHRNASDPNRLTAHNNHDLEPGSVTAPSGSSSSSSLSSKSNESNTVTAERHASQSDWSDEDEPVIPAQWADSLPPQMLESLLLPPRIRKRQEVIHELIVSEASHVKWLKVLARIFHRPLEAQPTLLPAEELAALFPNLHSVREHHARLYADLRTARQEAGPVVPMGPVADALLATLGASAYAPSLSRFCRGQRMALDSLRERRRKHKELHQFLSAREQLPLCGRLQLRDLLACVWQRLTKYQLLLESIVKTVDEDEEDPDEITRLRRALDVAKEVLQCVDAAIRTAENEHRLRTIQSKLEARAPSGAEWDEIRRLDLTTRTLRTEGELAIRTDNAKRVNVLALMLEDCLVLLQREGDRFLLKPFSQPNYSQLLSPIIRWDKVLFRPNAAERHTFFLMNINHVQMHELTASSAAEYATWVKHIQDAPLAKLAEFKGSFTSSHHATRSSDESGANVSRNPSDASERSAPIGGSEEAEPLLATPPTPPVPPPPPPPPRPSLEREASTTTEPVPTETKVREPATVGSITRQSSSPPALEPAGAVRVREARRAHAAATALSPRERMRRLDARLAAALRDKSLVVAEVLGVPRDSYSQLAELAVADTLGQVENEGPAQPEDMHQLLLAAQTQATQLTEMAARALNVSETMAMATRASGLCDSCRSRGRRQDDRREQWESFDADKDNKDDSNLLDGMESDDMSTSDVSLGECGSWRGAELAARLACAAGGLQGALGRVLALLPAMQADRQALRQQLAAARDANDALRQRLRAADPNDPPDQDQPNNGG